jgi:hypothetical protein
MTESRYEQPVATVHAHPRERFPSGPEAARDECAVHVRQLVRQRDARILFGQHIRRMAAVTLPTVCGAQFTRARDHVAGAAILTYSTTADVVEYDAVARAKALAAGPRLQNAPARFVTCDNVAVCLIARAEMFAVDRANVATANSGRLHLDEHLAEAGHRHRLLAVSDRAVTRQDDARHRGFKRCCARHRMQHP